MELTIKKKISERTFGLIKLDHDTIEEIIDDTEYASRWGAGVADAGDGWRDTAFSYHDIPRRSFIARISACTSLNCVAYPGWMSSLMPLISS